MLNRFFLSLCLGLLMLTACNNGEQGTLTAVNESLPAVDWSIIPEQLPDSMKGYELYSWQTGSTRIYTLVTGTNRSKSFSEITVVENTLEGGYLKISTTSPEELKKLLGRLPANTEVFWGGIDLAGEVDEGTIYFSYPADEEMNEILGYAQELGINLHTVEETQEGEQ